MNNKLNLWKIITTFIAAFTTIIFCSGSSKAISVKTNSFLEPTIEERLAKVREHLQQQKRQVINTNSSVEAEEIQVSQRNKSSDNQHCIPPRPWCNWSDKPKTPDEEPDEEKIDYKNSNIN